MRKLFTLATLTLAIYSIFSQVGATPSGGIDSDNSKGELVDIKANLVFPHKVNDTLSVLCLVGDFAAQHNGAVITADSAVRYDDERLECFGNVLINKNTTYAYCDRADYDSANNLASLYSNIIKVVDEDITLYTYNFTFNTLDNIGKYWGGGVTTKPAKSEESESQDEILDEQSEEQIIYDIMESTRGYYYADNKSVIGVEKVELQGDGYQMTGDSVIYEMESERALFFGKTNIWCKDGEYIYGDAGLYDKAQGLYSVTNNGYLLTEDQEVWSDSLEYYRDREEAILRKNIQIIDTTNKSLAFGDYGQYWGDVERILMTRNPLVINYDTQQPEQPADSIFLRGDTIEIISYALGTGPFSESSEAAAAEAAIPDGIADMIPTEAVEEITQEEEHDHDHTADSLETEVIVLDSLATDSIQSINLADTLPSKSELKAIAREKKELARVTAERAREYRNLEKRREKLTTRINKRLAKERSIYSDSMVLLRVNAELANLDNSADSLKADSLDTLDSLVTENVTIVEDTPERDSLYRVVLAYRNVRSFRSDVQMICDSMVSNSYDTVMNLYIAPIVWSDKNQISAEQMDFYTRDGAMDYADFFGNPIMASQVIAGDTTYINQVTGKEMRALFENNNVTRNDVMSNVRTIYFMQDDQTLEVNTIAYIESGSATFFIENQQLDGVIYRQNPNYTFAPLLRRPTDIPLYLPGFKWESERRPTRKNIMDRTIRPSIRAEKSTLERPQFPIRTRMDKNREMFEKRKIWIDRIEDVAPDAAEWMRTLGFTPGEPRKEGEGF